MLRGRQPGWLDQMGLRLAALTHWALRSGSSDSGVQPLRFYRQPRAACPALTLIVSGLAWAAIPCGMLYSALVRVMISAKPVDGALAMAGFAMASAIPLLAVQRIIAIASLQRQQSRPTLFTPASKPSWLLHWQSFGARTLGLLMIVSSSFAIYSVALDDARRLLCVG